MQQNESTMYEISPTQEGLLNEMEQVANHLGAKTIQFYVLQGVRMKRFSKLGGTEDQIMAKLKCKGRHIGECRAIYKFCKEFPLMLFCPIKWSNIRHDISGLRGFINENKTESLWQLPHDCPNAEVVQKLLGISLLQVHPF